MRTAIRVLCCSLALAATGCSAGAGRDAQGPSDAGVDARADQADAGLATGSVRGRIDGLDPADAHTAVASAGDVSRALGSPYFTLDAVRAGGAVSVFARAPGYSLGHAQVPVIAGQVTPVLLRIVKLESRPLSDPDAAQELAFGPQSAPARLKLPAAALVPAYGGTLQGQVRFEAAVLDASTAPAASLLRGEGGGLRLLAVVELRATQPSAALTLQKPAVLELELDASDTQDVQAYRFDETRGAWQPQPDANLDASSHTLQLTIDRLGVYAAATAAGELGCSEVSLRDPSGQPLARAAVRYADAPAQQGAQAWTDASGQACLQAAAPSSLRVRALGLSDTQLLSAEGEVAIEAAAASCGGDCAKATLEAAPAAVSCARGRIGESAETAAITLWVGTGTDDEVSAGRVNPGQPFCVDFVQADHLRLDGSLHCGEPKPLDAAPAANSCGGDCLDLGTITCCADVESCGNAIDDDCDQRVDEGCRCGDADCGAVRASHMSGDFCCTQRDTCGIRDRTSKVDDQYCFDLQVDSRQDPDQCPDQVLDLGKGKQAVTGCCRADDRCGFKLAPFDCVPREEAKYFITADTEAPTAKGCKY